MGGDGLKAIRIGILVFLSLFLVAAIFVCHHRVVSASYTPVTGPVTLILDAGHGGEDGGATTPSGQRESDINLRIVQKMDFLLSFCGINAVLTRSDDCSIHDPDCVTLHEKKVSDLKNRVSIVNSHENAIFISVHQNSFTDPAYSGFQVFYNTGDLSRQWGERTQELLQQTVDSSNHRKAKILSDTVYLFRHIDCPSILVECGFLSNAEEAALLLTDHYQKQFAVALTGSCLRQLGIMESFSGGETIG